MPELPEVETVMRGLEAALLGRRISRVMIRRPDLRSPLPPDLGQVLTGARIAGFRRRAKYMLMRLDRGPQAPAQSVLWHLGMSGRMVINGPADQKHEHVVLECGDVRVGYVDPRRFGSIDLVATTAEDQHRLLAHLGPEPLSEALSGAFLRAAFAGKRTAIKLALLDQTLIAGLGNIYVCEALFRARIHPLRPCAAITAREANRLAIAIRATLQEAIAAGGSSLRDYVQASGELGYFQHQWRVYGKEGESCPDCAGNCQVQRIAQGGRSSFFCAKKQK